MVITDRLGYSLEQAAEITGIDTATLSDLADAGILGFQPKVKGKPCGAWVFPQTQLATWMEANGATTTTQHRPDAMPIKEAARRLDCDPKTVRTLIQHKKLAAFKLGRAIRVKTASLEKYMGEKLR
ncbi:MAG: helix-turn-helix domain-containing protein [Propionibacteriaceae bacterium]|jgi:excisionase family DNA binding protein|nr:helix-turn-helix domain-containing protein [Propionibacteriaceae bacterium]